jgi:hypothetical protein
MLEDGLDILELECGGDSENAFTVKAILCAKSVAMGVKPQEISESLYGNGGAGNRIGLWHSFPKKDLQ